LLLHSCLLFLGELSGFHLGGNLSLDLTLGVQEDLGGVLAGGLFELLLFVCGVWYKRFKVVESFLNPIIEDLHKLLDFLELY